jgi:EAL domain-containing protein (putative c-di-GMP-specific phosphodiesterase class I)/GGDEF domain-containing protein
MDVPRPALSLVVGLLLALALCGSSLRAHYQLNKTLESARLQAMLEAAADEIGADLAHGQDVMTLARPSGALNEWHYWQIGASKDPSQGQLGLRIDASILARVLGTREAVIGAGAQVGVFATDTGSDALVVASAVRNRDSIPEWRGAWKFVDAMLSQPNLAAMVKQGYRVQLYDADTAAALFQSDTGSLAAAIGSAPVRFGGRRLALKASPGSVSILPVQLLSPALLMALTVALWLTRELQRTRSLSLGAAALSEAEARRSATNLQYERALESIASLEARLHLTSMQDAATGLANRASFARRIESYLEELRTARRGTLCLLAIGFDRIPQVSSLFGSDFAGRILVLASERARSRLPAGDLLFRTSDFNLGVMLPDFDTARGQEIAQKVIDAFVAPVKLDTHSLLLQPRIGLSYADSGYDNAETLLDQAEAALGAAQVDSTRRYCLFESNTTREFARRLQLEADLRKAVEEGQFVLEYQAFVQPLGHAVVGFEALIRWEHPTEGRLMPSDFLPIAAQMGLMPQLDSWVMREAARQTAEWRRAGHHEVFVNFNLSAEVFARPNLIEEITVMLSDLELPGAQLNIEITESTLLEDTDSAAQILKDLSTLGIGTWLDDFGTGYSSLNHMRALPLKGVKLDRSFIERIEIDARDFGLVKALIDLINYLGMQSIVEGIETAAQCELLGMTTCDLYQGYYFFRSMSATQAGRLLSAPSISPDAVSRQELVLPEQRLKVQGA